MFAGHSLFSESEHNRRQNYQYDAYCCLPCLSPAAQYQYFLAQEDSRMAWTRFSDEDVLKLLREIDVHLHDGLDVVSACRKAGVSDKTYYHWRKKFGGLSR